MATAVPTGVEIYPLSLDRYERMIEQGILGPGDHVELIRGILATMAPQGARHAAVIQWLTQTLVRSVDPARLSVRVQLPLRLASIGSVPEPDLAVVAAGAYADRHPSTAELVIEVADSSIATDLATKAGVYAAAGIPELWVVEVEQLLASVHRRPSQDRYQDMTRKSGRISPLTSELPEIDLGELRAHLT